MNNKSLIALTLSIINFLLLVMLAGYVFSKDKIDAHKIPPSLNSATQNDGTGSSQYKL